MFTTLDHPTSTNPNSGLILSRILENCWGANYPHKVWLEQIDDTYLDRPSPCAQTPGTRPATNPDRRGDIVDALEEHIRNYISTLKSVLETIVTAGADKPKVCGFDEVLRFIEMFESTLCREHAFVAASRCAS